MTIQAISLEVEDAPALFYDPEAFATIIAEPAELRELVAAHKGGGVDYIGKCPIVAYYTDKCEIFSAHTVLGTVVAS